MIGIFGIFSLLTLPFQRRIEPSAQASSIPPAPVATIGDSLDSMDAATRSRFNLQVATVRDLVVRLDEPSPAGAVTSERRADFAQRAQRAQGTARLMFIDKRQTLRFENFRTDNGPELRVFLSPALNAADVIDLGPLRATQGSLNYAVPEGTDTRKYNKVLIWCNTYGVLYSYAEF